MAVEEAVWTTELSIGDHITFLTAADSGLLAAGS